MSADFWAGYVSGAVSILVGNPLDIIKTRLQAGGNASLIPTTTSAASSTTTTPLLQHAQSTLRPNTSLTTHWSNLVRGSAAPILGYGALNALLFMTYNRSLSLLQNGTLDPSPPGSASNLNIFAAGALGGLATFVVSAPTELIKCRAQISRVSSGEVARELWRRGGLKGVYLGGGITSLRDAVGYGFYFWSYELSKTWLTRPDDTDNSAAVKVMLCGGLAGVVTWASIFPLDVIKTRIQTYDLLPPTSAAATSTSRPTPSSSPPTPILNPRASALQIAQQAYRTEGLGVFFRGLGVCSIRAFVVNAVQWAIYEWMMKELTRES
ncbi:mitochondrial carrier protein-like protein [Dissoconium aciculare CBS 342.82]|uniref:Mitochondrial carrier protein-like protein n=1 Tax=Dissoconium aciculare CBS 342.82 TaxID=1314786 RepID=A0A6J3LS30_9PEZI|nr:mitochondrial carrier protein-like protein [Dissoconium aciculare CBS 342.82]KAF1818428.1 mitochondrial carrier protein-like protein [Dissoconium aciculare CBS 342.82]